MIVAAIALPAICGVGNIMLYRTLGPWWTLALDLTVLSLLIAWIVAMVRT